MVHISKQTLNAKQSIKLFAQFNQTIGNLNHTEAVLFLEDFLGPEEKVLFAKRLAAIIMLSHEQSSYKVAKVLKMSSSTADGFQTNLRNGKYDQLLRVIQKKKKGYIELLDTIDSILHLGGLLPHYGQTYASEAYKNRKPQSFD